MELLRFNFLYLRRWLAFALLPMQDVDEIEEALDNMEALREIGIFE